MAHKQPWNVLTKGARYSNEADPLMIFTTSVWASQVSALLKKLKIHNDNVHCVFEKKFRRKYVTRAGIKAVGDFIREKPLDAIRTFGSKAAIEKYEQQIAEE